LRAESAVLFSATLTPPEYFCSVLGGGKQAKTVSLPSPFDSERLCIAVADYVNTRFEEREDNAKRFATVIAATVKARAGNYIAYFPSYKCLEQTYLAFARKYPNVTTVVQKKNMTASEKQEFLSAFKDDSGKLRVGFCVLGGVFSEGVDLPGSRLIGSIVFGVGLPALSNEKNIIKEHYDSKNDEGVGYDYAYTFPGMNNVLQAAGRVIRTSEDIGIVVLADDRYATPKYRSLFPAHWKGVQYAGNASSLAEIMRRFWEKDL
jgi:Rad3-related DNA helicase